MNRYEDSYLNNEENGKAVLTFLEQDKYLTCEIGHPKTYNISKFNLKEKYIK